jgi:hypothetical protein
MRSSSPTPTTTITTTRVTTIARLGAAIDAKQIKLKLEESNRNVNDTDNGLQRDWNNPIRSF